MRILKGILLYIFCTLVYAESWYTNPLIALSGETLDVGSGTFELYNYYSETRSIYTQDWTQMSSPRLNSTQISPQLTYGLAKGVDVELITLYERNLYQRRSFSQLGDSTVILGLQALKQDENKKFSAPSLRVTIQEVFPTGAYDLLKPANLGTDATGTGSYQTVIGFNFEYKADLIKEHELKAHFCVLYSFLGDLRLRKSNIYGGTRLTEGRIHPGDAVSIDLAGELTLTQHWVGVMEAYFLYQQPSKFYGFAERALNDHKSNSREERIRSRLQRLIPSRNNLGSFEVGHGSIDLVTLAPAIEYNFSKNFGIIAGAWFTTAGKNTPEFISSIVALNFAW
jgi:hypothetical protein